MNSISNYISEPIIIIVSVVFLLFTPVLMGGLLMDTVANAAYVQQNYPVPISSQYSNQLLDELLTNETIRYLRNGLWVKDYVTDDELREYITLCKQAASSNEHVTPELLLGVIAVESRFDKTCLSGSNARGLCQMIFGYHADRMKKITGEEADPRDFDVPWKNIFCAADYLEEIITETQKYNSVPEKDKVKFGLMWYNMGPATASTVYIDRGQISSYAENVTTIAETIGDIFAKGDAWCAKAQD